MCWVLWDGHNAPLLFPSSLRTFRRGNTKEGRKEEHTSCCSGSTGVHLDLPSYTSISEAKEGFPQSTRPSSFFFSFFHHRALSRPREARACAKVHEPLSRDDGRRRNRAIVLLSFMAEFGWDPYVQVAVRAFGCQVHALVPGESERGASTTCIQAAWMPSKLTIASRDQPCLCFRRVAGRRRRCRSQEASCTSKRRRRRWCSAWTMAPA